LIYLFIDAETSYNLQVIFVYQGHRVRVKVTAAKSMSVHSIWVLNFECFDVEC